MNNDTTRLIAEFFVNWFPDDGELFNRDEAREDLRKLCEAIYAAGTVAQKKADLAAIKALHISHCSCEEGSPLGGEEVLYPDDVFEAISNA